jgi:hypothetical protein
VENLARQSVRAGIALSSSYAGVDIHVMTAEADSGQPSVEQVRERLVELWVLTDPKPDPTDQLRQGYREGHRISTARVE